MKMAVRCCLIVYLLVLILPDQRFAAAGTAVQFFHGVDLSYVNEMEDCGAVYHAAGEPRDPYQIFFDYGANLVRLRLWHTPTWTNYSTLDDVILSIARAKALGMAVMLDFHYSDTWADPAKQIIPAAWAEITDVAALADALYRYTHDTLMTLNSLGLLPDIVQVGNEINSEILRAVDAPGWPINWQRNALLLNTAIRAVRDAAVQSGEVVRVMLHIAKPEQVEGWLSAAEEAGVRDFDIVGISYYPAYSNHSISTMGGIVRKIASRFGKDVMIAETAYPWTMQAVAESANNIVGEAALEEGYPATPDGQRRFMIDVTQTVLANGGIGVIYWEPAWVSTKCRTLWGQGSHWENATFFDFRKNNELLSSIDYLQHPYEYPVEVMLRLRITGSEPPEQVFFWGDFTGMGRRMITITGNHGEFNFRALLLPGTAIRYQFYAALPASAETALIAGACVNADGVVSASIPDEATVLPYTAGSCG